jgi:hypothetical protein
LSLGALSFGLSRIFKKPGKLDETDDSTHFYLSLTPMTISEDLGVRFSYAYFGSVGYSTDGVYVDWGDGTVDLYTNTTVSTSRLSVFHTYADYGDYDMRVYTADAHGFSNIYLGSMIQGTVDGVTTSYYNPVLVDDGSLILRSDFVVGFVSGKDVKYIRDKCFWGMRNLKYVDLSRSVGINVLFGDEAFLACFSLTDVKFPDTLLTVSDSAFRGCVSLRFVDIPASVTHLNNAAFDECYNLDKVILRSLVPPRGQASLVFGDNVKAKAIYVPDESLELYLSAAESGESKFAYLVPYYGLPLILPISAL